MQPKGRFRHVDLEELKILDSSSSFNELASSSAVASIQRKGENVNASGHCSISLQDLSLGPVLAVGSAGRIYYGIHGSQVSIENLVVLLSLLIALFTNSY
jgi:hypothetical protein